MLISIFLLVIWLSPSLTTSINKQCRDLLQCSIKQKCVNLPWLVDKMAGKEINVGMYNDIDAATDYGCIFTAGCFEECNRCPLCSNSKLQVVEILSGSKVTDDMECPDLLNCAMDCVSKSADDITMINHCLRHTCAYHCFDGDVFKNCPKCSAFVTRVFNQMCIAGNFKKITKNFEGQCYEMFREIVYTKFKSLFDNAGIKPAIGPRQL